MAQRSANKSLTIIQGTLICLAKASVMDCTRKPTPQTRN